jgi:DNA-binding response OmpR family regulator
MQTATDHADDDTADTLPPPRGGSQSVLRQPTRVLLVEPAPLIRHFITRALVVNGYQVHSAGSLGELDYALGIEPHVVLVELNLADGTGDSVCRLVRAQLGAFVPVVLMSSGSPEELARRTALCGADGCFSKTKGLNVLLPIVHELALDAEVRRQGSLP